MWIEALVSGGKGSVSSMNIQDVYKSLQKFRRIENIKASSQLKRKINRFLMKYSELFLFL